MDAISRFLQASSRLLTWWVNVMPWESGMRVRCGRWITTLSPGIHLKLPILDLVYKQSVRLRVLNMPVQTVTTKDGKTVTLSCTVGYSIADIRKLYDTLHHPEDTIGNLVLSAVAQHVTSNAALNCGPQQIEEAALGSLKLERYGLSEARVYVTDFAFVRTFRVINDQRWSHGGPRLDTTTVHDAPI